jgi:hypothetical protein
MRALVVVFAMVGACSAGPQASPQPVVAPPPAAGSAATVAVVADSAVTDAAVAVAPADASVLGDLPAFTLELPANRADIDVAEKLNTAGYAAHKKKDWPAAIAKYGEALKKDPGHMLARYNLASAYHSSGDDVRALAVLAQFEQSNCRACDAILLHSKTDSEWKGLAANAEYKAIVDSVAPAEKVDLVKVTAKISKAFRTKKLDEILPYVHPHAAIRHREWTYDEREPHPPFENMYVVAELQQFVDQLPKKYIDQGARPGVPCEKKGMTTCCQAGPGSDSSYQMGSVCFSMIGGVPFINEIQMDPGGNAL